MDWLPAAMDAFAAFFGSLLLVSRVIAWIAGLVLAFGATVAWMLYVMWAQLGQSLGLIAIVVGVSLGGGYVFSWFMWQWYGASLQARESARQRTERGNAV